MSDLFAILNKAANGLNAHRTASDTASHNIANVNTPGYSRQRAVLGTAVPQQLGRVFMGAGVRVLDITRAHDQFLEAQLPLSQSNASAFRTEATILQSVSVLNPTAAQGLAQGLSGFYAAVRGLSQNPGDLGLRRSVLAASAALASGVAGAASAVEVARTGVDARISAQVEEVNGLLGQMAALNAKVASADGGGLRPNDLLDQRQAVQDRIVALTGAVAVPTGNGSLNLTLKNGAPLVTHDRAGRLSTLGDGADFGHLDVLLSPPSGSTPMPVDGTHLGGELGGALSARDGALKAAGDALDAFAVEFAGAVNAAHSAGFALDGSSGRPLFDVGPSTTGAARAFRVNVDVAADPRLLAAAGSSTAAPGDAGALIALLDTESVQLPSGRTPGGALAMLTTEFGSSAQSAVATAAHEEGILGHLTSMRESVSGVSIDEELIELTKAQRAFEAVGKVIQTADQMLETLLQLK